MKVKLCGFTDEESVIAAIAEKCDFLGFVFCDKSPRYIPVKDAAKISACVPQNIAKVAVVVDEKMKTLEEISQNFSPDFFQFHGAEDVKFLQKVRQKFPQIKIIKSVSVESDQDLERAKIFYDHADFLLFDSKVSGVAGGSGTSFDWQMIKNFYSQKDWFLSGGLNVNNIENALRITKAKMIDVSSGIEKIRGKKSPELIKEFMNKVRTICS